MAKGDKKVKAPAPVVEGKDPKVASPAPQEPQVEVGIVEVDVVPDGFRPVTEEEGQMMNEIGRMLELALTKKRAVEAEIRERQAEHRGVMAELGGIRAISDGLRKKLGTSKPGDLLVEKKTGRLYVPVQKKGKKAKGPWDPSQGGVPPVKTTVTTPKS